MGLYKSLHKAMNDLEAEPPNDLGLKQSERKRVNQDVGLEFVLLVPELVPHDLLPGVVLGIVFDIGYV